MVADLDTVSGKMGWKTIANERCDLAAMFGCELDRRERLLSDKRESGLVEEEDGTLVHRFAVLEQDVQVSDHAMCLSILVEIPKEYRTTASLLRRSSNDNVRANHTLAAADEHCSSRDPDNEGGVSVHFV